MRTPTKDEAGKSPVWNYSIDLFIKNIEDTIILDVKDQDVTSSDDIGTLKCPVKDILDKQRLTIDYENWFDITYKNKSAGKIRLKTTFLWAHLKD